jgi:hypothetical protein
LGGERMSMIARRRALMAGKKAEPELVDINNAIIPRTYNQGQYDYNNLELTEYPEPETTYRFVVDAEMPEGVGLAIALGPRINGNILSFPISQNGEVTLEKATVAGSYDKKAFYIRHSGGTGKVSFTIRSIHIYKLPNS